MDLPMPLNASMYTKSVTSTSVNIALNGVDVGSVNPNANGYKVIVKVAGSSNIYIEAGFGSAPTVVYPTDGTNKNGQVFMSGAVETWTVPLGTTHLSMIADVAGTNLVHVTFGGGV